MKTPATLTAMLLLAFILQAGAQVIPGRLNFTIPLKERRVKAGELTGITLKVSNTGKVQQAAIIRVSPDAPLHVAAKDSISVKLAPGDSTFVTIRILVPQRTPAGKNLFTRFFLEDKNGVLQQDSCKLVMENERNVILIPLMTSVVLSNANDSIRIPVRIANRGNSIQKVTLAARFPSVVQTNGFYQTTQLEIQPFTEQTVEITKKITRELLQLESFTVSINGFYLSGDLFGQCNTDVQSLKSIRYSQNAAEPERYFGSYNNSFSLSAQNLGSEYTIYQLSGGGIADLPNGRIGFNTDAMLYRDFQNKPFLRNTWISYESNNVGISAGNINRNYDLNLNGRGISLFYADTANKSHFEAGIIDNNVNLLGSGTFDDADGHSGWGRFSRRSGKLDITSTAVFNRDPITHTGNTLLGHEVLWMPTRKFRLSGSLYGGTSELLVDDRRHESGLLGSFGLEWQVRKFTLSSTNLLSGPWYPGIRKGTAVFSERVSFNSGKTSIWTGYNYLNNKPRYLSGYLNFAPNYRATKAEFGFSRIFGKLSVSLSPVYQQEGSSYLLSESQPLTASLQSFRLQAQASYATAGKSMFLTIERGYTKNSSDYSNRSQTRISGNIRYGLFNMNASAQYGVFYVNELMQGILLNNRKFSNIQLNPGIQKNFMGNRLSVEAGLSFSNISNAGKSLLFTGRSEYRLFPGTSISAAIARSQYEFNQYQFSYSNLQVGITQQIPKAHLGRKNNILEVLLFKDINQNNIYDTGDTLAKNQLVYISGTPFITGKDGRIVYKNLPDGSYKIAVSGNGQWYAPDQPVQLKGKNGKIEVPLSKTGTLKGSISYSFNEFSYEINKEKAGLTIKATSDNGSSITTKTNDNGQFVFYIPAGSYIVGIADEDLPEEVECHNNSQSVSISPSLTQKISFDLAVKTRKIEVKKFISTRSGEKGLDKAGEEKR